MDFPRITAIIGLAVIGSGIAQAGTSTDIFGGGSVFAEKIGRAILDCAGTPIGGEAQNKACTKPAADGYEFYYAGVDSATGIAGLMAETAQAHTLDTGIVSTDSNHPSYPYPHWHFTISETPLDSLTEPSGKVTDLKIWAKSPGRHFRGQLWQYPIGAFGLALAFNPGVSGKSPISLTLKTSKVTGVAGELDLDRNQTCFIWTGTNAKGKPVAGKYDWSNPLLLDGVTKVTKKKTLIEDNPAYAGIAPSGSALAIQPVVRTDFAGSTFVLTAWLKKNCKGYGAAGYGLPTSDPAVFPAKNPGGKPWLTAATSNAMASAVAGTVGAIGYVTPDKVAPLASSGPLAAFVATEGSKPSEFTYLYPTEANVEASIGILPAPAADKSGTAWGAKLNEDYFKKKENGTGYPLVSLTWLMGYQCYVNDTTSGEIETGIENFAKFLWATDGANGDAATQADKILIAAGIVPLSDPFKTSILETMTDGGKRALVGVPTSYAKLEKKKGSGSDGPKACSKWNLDPNRF
jgi:ABC-type phosphate transport system substrate-binding protein